MMGRAKFLLVLAVAVSLILPALAAASEPCSAVASAPASTAEAFLATLQVPAAAPLEAGALPFGAQPKVLYCTKEVCSAARADCRAWCPFPCAMVFECNYPSCGSCISCTC